MNNYDAIIIDSGYSGQNKKNIAGVNLYDKETVEVSDNIGHGTSVTDLIIEKCPESNLLMIKICDSYTDFSCDTLCSALRYIVTNKLHCNVLNISLGIQRVDNFKLFSKLIEQIISMNIVVVSAYHSKTMSFPAAFKDVIGVDVNSKIKSLDDFVYNENGIIDIIGSDSYIRFAQNKNKSSFNRGSSFIAAKISGLLVRFFYKNDNCSDRNKVARQYLKSIAKTVRIFHDPVIDRGAMFLKTTKQAIALPFNKEIAALAANEDLINFEIANYFDFEISLNKNKLVSSVLPHSNNQKKIRSICEINWENEFDTVICGHCKEYEVLTGSKVIDNIIHNCMVHNKKIYCFDDLSDKKNINDLNCYFPCVHKNMVPKDRYNKLFELSKPILAIMGTSSVQGKYSLQLTLRRQLLSMGYNVSNIGTEPNGYIFGFDYIFPIGYESKTTLNPYEFTTLVNNAIWNSEQKDPDIIIIGSQSGTIPIANNNLEYFLFRQYELLLGCNPDAVLLCVNSFDSDLYIKKTINFIESCTHAKVIALVLSPIKKPNNGFSLRHKRDVLETEEILFLVEQLKQRFGISVYPLGIDTKQLTNEILYFFGGHNV